LVLDVASRELQTLEVAQWGWGLWLDEQRVLVGENINGSEVRWAYNVFATYDTQTRERAEVMSAEVVPDLAGQEFTGMSLSPDRRWLAFVASRDLVSTHQAGVLWVLALDTDD